MDILNLVSISNINFTKPTESICPFSIKLTTQINISKVSLERYFRGERLPWDSWCSEKYTHRDTVSSDLHSLGRGSGRITGVLQGTVAYCQKGHSTLGLADVVV